VIGYIIRRIGQAAIVILGVTVIVFILRQLLPGSIARAIIGLRATPQQIAAFNQQNGLNRPVPLQYVSFLDQLVHGNLGYSFKQNMSVDAIVAHELPNDALLIGSSLVLALLIAIPVGLIQAVRRNKLADHAATGLAFVLYSMPGAQKQDYLALLGPTSIRCRSGGSGRASRGSARSLLARPAMPSRTRQVPCHIPHWPAPQGSIRR
jgi:ABC-type dipeptide/oligopeptide/nickel transport system permease component